MKSLKYLKTILSFVLLGILLCAAIPNTTLSKNSRESAQPSPTFVHFSLFKNVLGANNQDIKISPAPIQGKNTEHQSDTEPRTEEEDTNEKNLTEPAAGLKYDVNRIRIVETTFSGVNSISTNCTNELYILYHSWKIFTV